MTTASAPPVTNKPPLQLKFMPHFYTQRKLQERLARPNLQSKHIKEALEGVAAIPAVETPTKKFRSKPFSARQKAAHQRMAIACKRLERQNDRISQEAREQTKTHNRQNVFYNKLGRCKRCNALVHRGSHHSEWDCDSTIMRGKLRNEY